MSRTATVIIIVATAVLWAPTTSYGGATGQHLHPSTRAITEAKTVLADAPTLSAAVRHHDAPVARLRVAPETAAYDALVLRTRFWTVKESAADAIAELTANPLAGYTKNGTGTSGGPRRRDTIYDVSYLPHRLPGRIAYAELQLAVTPTGHGTSAIGAYGQAVPRPRRPASESVPASVHKVQVTKVRGVGDKHPRQRTIGGRQARRLVAAFNALPASAPGESTCAEDHGQYDAASFSSRGNVWVASIGPCPGVAVVRDGKALPPLDESPAFYRQLHAALRPRH